jgi:ribosomal protein S18 acetylase RimI-like enzyme
MTSLTVDIRSAERRDARGVAVVHDEAWSLAYAGVIPAMHLRRMVQRRGPEWWAGTIGRARGGVMVAEVGAAIAGYATIGSARKVAGMVYDGEVFELYVKPEYQGLGFGRRLFHAARERLVANGRPRIIVWALSENEPAVAFYRRLGGKPVARDQERFGATVLPKVGFAFT